MKKKLVTYLFTKVFGWKVTGTVPKVKKYLIVVAPHTSNWDFFLGLALRQYFDDFKPRFLGKKELFVFPFGYLFRWLGGYPIERSKSTNFVDALVDVYNKHDQFATTITPEGTRSYNPNWKTGFYHIAKNADIPILRVGIDATNKQIIMDELYYISKPVEETIVEFKKFFSAFEGINKEKGVKWPE